MSAFRPDIQALRAIAVLLVLAFHVWPTRVTGGYVGVDVFFVISGYLITGHLVREVASTGRVDLPAFYARRARRLLPAASLTLVAVGLAAYLWMPALAWPTVAADMAASTLYAENWALVRRAVDYNAQGQAPSPLQHFWSLAVEEQFYLGWPLLMAGVAAAWRRRVGAKPTALPGLATMAPPPPRRAYAAPMGILCALSMLTSLYYARANPAAGYFMTHTRLHELGVGGLLAVWAVGAQDAGPHAGLKPGTPASHPKTSHWPRTLCAAAGLVAIGASGCLFTPRLPFPGAAALVPVLGAAAVIAAGEGGGAASCVHALAPALAHPWLQYVGDISYSLYLAHWPVVVVYPFVTGRAVDGALADGVTVLALSWALAHACKRGWEDRFRSSASRESMSGDDQSRPAPLLRTTWWLIACLMVGCLVAAILLSRASRHTALSARPDAEPGSGVSGLCVGSLNSTTFPGPVYLGAEAIVKDAVRTGAAPLCRVPLSRVLPSIGGAGGDKPPAYQAECFQVEGTDIRSAQIRLCHGDGGVFNHKKVLQGVDQAGHEESEPPQHKNKSSSPHIVLLGDSHVLHWLPAFAAVGRRRGWNVTGISRSACLIASGDYRGSFGFDGRSDDMCRAWLANALAFIADSRPTAVVLTAVSGYQHNNKAFADSADALEVAAKGVEHTIAAIRAAGVDVLAIKETPRAGHDVPTCLASAVRVLGEDNATAACTLQAADCLKDGPLNRAVKADGKIKVLSFDDAFCGADGACPPIIGNVLAFRDNYHLTNTFAKTLAPALERRILAVLPFV